MNDKTAGFLVITMLCMFSGLVLSFLKISRSRQRRIYWSCAVVGAVSGFFCGYPDLHKGLALAVFVGCGMVVVAFRGTPYIKIRGKIYAMSALDRRADDEDALPPTPDRPVYTGPDSYRGASPTKAWWVLVGVAVIPAVNAVAFVKGGGAAWVAATSVAMLVMLMIAAGYQDGSGGWRIARGQYLPFFVAAVITADISALVYLAAYYTGLLRPSRRQADHAGPRHQEA